MVVLGVLCCIAAGTASAATTYTCSLSVAGQSSNTINANVLDPITFVVGVAPGVPDGGSVELLTANGYGFNFYDSSITPTGATFDWLAQAGLYDVRAIVMDSNGITVCTSLNDVVINVATPQALTTVTSVTLSPPSPGSGAQATATAHITVSQSSAYTLSGNVVFYGDSAQYGATPIVPIDSTHGIATFDITTPSSTGSHIISAWYLGDEHFAPSSGAVSIGVVKAEPTLTNVHGTPTHYKGSTTLSAQLLDGGVGVPGRTIDFTTSTGETCSAVTDTSGVAACTPYAVNHAAGNYTVTASFAGDSAYAPLTGSGPLAVTAANTTIAYAGPPAAAVNQPVTLSATLFDEDGNALQGEHVTLAFHGGADSCVATVQASGSAACTIANVAEAPGSYLVDVTYAGSPGFYNGAATTGAIDVVTGIPTTLTFVPSGLPVVPGLPTPVKFRLTDPSGPVANATVAITFAGVTQTATTNAGGYAVVFAVAPPVGGPAPAGATFTADGTHLGSIGSGMITVLPAPTVIKVTNVQPIQQGTKPTLSANLKLWNGAPLAHELVTLSAGGSSCTAYTDASGNASCQVTTPVAGPSRDLTITASFAGEPGVLLASKDCADGFVWSFLGGGTFVRGDRDLDDGVLFWGAQWAKTNPLSHGSAPDAFKGFAGTVSTPTQCTISWTTRPGNSTPPPKGPLPAYMAVVVSSSITKSGSSISGDVKKIVIVKTAPGYDSNPGHAGTGVVVGTVCG